MIRIAAAAAFAYLCSSLSLLAQEPLRDIPRDPKAAIQPVQRYPLPDGALLHAQYSGEIVRVDAAGKQLAKAKVPRSRGLASTTTIVLSADFRRALVVHRVDDFDFQAKHRVSVLDMKGLRKLADLPLGKCESYPFAREFPAVTERLTMFCYHSRPPSDAKRKPTLAIVTIDMNGGEVARWTPVEGERHGQWFGPMFFGWGYDARPVEVNERLTCAAPADDQSATERSKSILVMNHDSETRKGDVWLVDPAGVDAPRLLTGLDGHPRSAVSCALPTGARVLQVTIDLRTTKQIHSSWIPSKVDTRVDTIDLATGKLLAQ